MNDIKGHKYYIAVLLFEFGKYLCLNTMMRVLKHVLLLIHMILYTNIPYHFMQIARQH